jgi:hypothetical protein
LRRSTTAQQAVSPLASPMESRRVFMAHQHSSNNNNGGGGGSPTPQQQLNNNQMLGTPHSIGAVQLGFNFFELKNFFMFSRLCNSCVSFIS